MYYLVYKITNLLNNKYYIGTHVTKNFNDSYFGSGKLLLKAIDKYGIDNFSKDILHFCKNEKQMFKIENEFVSPKVIADKNCYNLRIGGDGGWSYINKNNLVKPLYNKINTNIYGDKGRNRMKYLYNNDLRFKKIMDEALSKAIKNSMIKYPNGVFKNKKHTKETKLKIGLTNSIKAKGERNSQFGTCWIYSLKERQNKKINKQDLNFWLEKNWTIGRKIKLFNCK